MMYLLDILRRPSPDENAYIQRFEYETEDPSATVATALTGLNARLNLTDAEGRPAAPIQWECSCLQKKCGACAMVINGRPALACDSFLKNLKGTVRLEPLRKFPVVADLIVDRSVLFENLKEIHLWFSENARLGEKRSEVAFAASRCLQCGCCLEVCPNFAPGVAFYGMAAAVPFSRLLAELPESQKKEASAIYSRHIYEGCGKSLACQDICPAGIDIEGLLVNSNAAAVWKRFLKGDINR